jgi:1,4-dihydroxy-2-naphthoyl-CoA hydrolase
MNEASSTDWRERLTQRMAGTFPEHLGIKIGALEPGRMELALVVQPHHLAPNGYLHAGVLVTLADTACGWGCYVNLPAGAKNFTTIELKTNFFRTTGAGVTIHTVATVAHSGRSTQVWDAVVQDDSGRQMALFRATQMILY